MRTDVLFYWRGRGTKSEGGKQFRKIVHWFEKRKNPVYRNLVFYRLIQNWNRCFTSVTVADGNTWVGAFLIYRLLFRHCTSARYKESCQSLTKCEKILSAYNTRTQLFRPITKLANVTSPPKINKQKAITAQCCQESLLINWKGRLHPVRRRPNRKTVTQHIVSWENQVRWFTGQSQEKKKTNPHNKVKCCSDARQVYRAI